MATKKEAKKKPVAPGGRKKKIIENERDKLTRAQAIKLQCIECMGYQKALVKDCTDKPCPLWTFRTGKLERTDIKVRK